MSDISVENLFEAAARGKWRFPFKGMISVEDLWDLSVENLDQIFRVLNQQRKKAEEESLLAVKSKEEEILNGKIELVKYIVAVKLAEKEAAQKAAQDKEKKQTILSVIASKQEEALKNCTIEELQNMIKKLEG